VTYLREKVELLRFLQNLHENATIAANIAAPQILLGAAAPVPELPAGTLARMARVRKIIAKPLKFANDRLHSTKKRRSTGQTPP
jgi:hypothetical protein